MWFETENTMLIQLVYGENDRVDKIIKLPKKLLFICDLFKRNSQLILYTNELIDIDTEKDLKYIILSVTNDPYSSYAGCVNNLGYFCLVWVIGDGVLTKNNPLTYITDNIDTIQVKTNTPLRRPNKIDGEYDIRFLSNNPNSYQIIEYNFNETLVQDIRVKYSVWDYNLKECECIERDINLFSAYNKSSNIQYIKDKDISTLYKFHNFKKLN